VIAALLLLYVREYRIGLKINGLFCLIELIFATYFAIKISTGGPVKQGMVYIDSLSMYFIFIIALMSFIISIYRIEYLSKEVERGHIEEKTMNYFNVLYQLFIFTMTLACSSENLGIIWIAIEGTTLASAFLVGFSTKEKSLEASWKYIMICSMGIAIAFLGVILIYIAGGAQIGDETLVLSFIELTSKAALLNPSLLKLAFLFIIVGYGTKAGLAPMHTWLPDAHSEAPTPISALLSGVLLNVALYGILRVGSIVKITAGAGFVNNLYIGFGLASILTASLFILQQRDFKRLLAYSSIENMGIILLAFGINVRFAVFAGLYHFLAHALTKSTLFMCAGNVYLSYETKEADRVRGVFKNSPVVAVVFIMGMLAITGTPGFAPFISEFNLVRGMFDAGREVIAVILLALLTLVFVGFFKTLMPMFYGEGKEGAYKAKIQTNIILAIMMVLIIGISFYQPPFIKILIDNSIKLLGGA
jgi:hydrogenase-4 component F